jgi:hypothetical protein
MKPLLRILALAGVLSTGMIVAPIAPGRTITDLKVMPTKILQRSVSPKFFKTLLISPIKGWVVVRGNLSGTRLTGLRVIRSEPNDLNNHLALQRAKEVEIGGNYTLDRPNAGNSVLVHLLLYQTADGMLALSFAHMDGAGGDQQQYYGCARLAVLKNDGGWVDIKGPEGLEGKGIAVRQGLRNNLELSLKLERPAQGAEAVNMSSGRRGQ